MKINTVMVIGAGQMGGGIAQVFAQTGAKVYLNDIKQEYIDKRMAFIEKLLTKDVAKGKKTEEEKAAVLAIMEVLYEGYSDSKYRPCPLLRQYVKAGWLGKKTGRGFYKYE